MQKNITTRLLTWRIQFPVLEEVWTINIAGADLESALTDLWGVKFPGFKKSNLHWKVYFRYKDTIWAKIHNEHGEVTDNYVHNWRIIKVFSGEIDHLTLRKRLPLYDKMNYDRFMMDIDQVEE